MTKPPDFAAREEVRNRPRHLTQVMWQRWSRLLFVHWEVDADSVAHSLPPGLHVDTFDDRAFLGVVPFFMERVRPCYLPPIPGISWFPELNVRTYCYDENGVPGVWFYSLDAGKSLASWLGRRWFGLPYFRAEMKVETSATHCHYQSKRRVTQRSVRIAYPKPDGMWQTADPGSLQYFLLERYVLFSVGRSGIVRTGRVWHNPYSFAPVASVQLEGTETLLNPIGLKVDTDEPCSVLYSPGVDVRIYGLA